MKAPNLESPSNTTVGSEFQLVPRRARYDSRSVRDPRAHRAVGRGGLPDSLVARMYRDYLRLKSLAKVGALYGRRSRQVMWEIFHGRNLPLEAKRHKTKVVYDGVTFTLHGGRGEGYLTSTTGARRPLHHVVWEKHHGPIPPGHNIVFRDRNPVNCAPGNLVCRTVKAARRMQESRRGKSVRSQAAEPKPVPVETVIALHAEYVAGASLRATARKCERSSAWLAGIFRRLGLSVRENPRRHLGVRRDGTSPPRPVRAVAQLLALADSLTHLHVPKELKTEWRLWSLALRGRFIARARRRLRSPTDRPKGSFSSNVEPFDYGSAAAHRIAAATVGARASHRVKISSQGVIWKEELWFWSAQHRSYVAKGRPFCTLHHAIWETAAGRSVPKGFCVCRADGNPNNLLPNNLVLRSVAELLPEFAGRAVFQRSRAITALLLQRSQRRGARRRDQLAHLLGRRGRR